MKKSNIKAWLKCALSIFLVCVLLILPSGTAFADNAQDTAGHEYDIRIVNMDVGADTEQSGNIIYSTALVKTPDEAIYRFSSLSEAEELLKNSRIDAYIIIPADFSECVESINSVPKACELTYYIDRYKAADIQYQTQQYVQGFISSLQKRVTQMYLTNLMEEVHTAQDAAQTVMENDRNNKAVLDEIQSSDLLGKVEFPAIPQTAPPQYTIDNSAFINRAAELVQNISDDFRTQAGHMQEETDLLKNETAALGTNLNAHMNNIRNFAERVEAVSPDSSIGQAEAVVQTSRTSIQGTAAECSSRIEQASSEIETLVNALKEAVKAANDEEKERLGKELQDAVEQCSAQIPVLAVTQEDGEMRLSWQKGEIVTEEAKPLDEDAQGTGSEEQEEITEAEQAPAIALHIETSEQDALLADNNRTLLALISEQMLASDQTEEVFEYEAITENGEEDAVDQLTYKYGQSVRTALDMCEEDANFKEKLALSGYATARDFLQAAVDGELLLAPEPYIVPDATEEEIADFCTYAVDAFEKENILQDIEMHDVDAYKKDADGNIVSDENGEQQTLYKDTAEALTEAMVLAGNAINATMLPSALAGLNEASAAIAIGQQTVSDIVTQVTAMKTNIADESATANAEISAYMDRQNSLSFTFSTQVGDEAVTGLNDNNEALLRDTQNAVLGMSEYANELYDETTSNYAMLKQYISDAQSASDQSVIDGLEKAKESWETTSRSNQELMQEFAALLQNTRVGTQEYQELYAFMAAPVTAKDMSPSVSGFHYIEKPDPDPQPSGVEEKDGIWVKQSTLNAFGATMAVAIVSLIAFFAWQFRKKSQLKNKDNANQFN